MRKIFKRILIVIVLLLIIAAVVAGFIIRATLPDWESSIFTSNVSREVKVTLDNTGVPHIKANSEEDLFFTLGYIHASERFFQMDLTRRYISGRLSELFGKMTLETDIAMRPLLMTRWAEGYIEKTSPEILSLLDRYCAGVNYFLSEKPRPLEYKLLGTQPENWEREDSILILLSMGWYLSGDGGEKTNAAALKNLGEKWYGFMRDRKIEDTHFVINPFSQMRLKENSRGAESELMTQATDALLHVPHREMLASNNWVIDGKLSTDGYPLLANDTHLGVTTPTHFYLVRLMAPGLNITGFSLPGAPVIAIGHNENIAWGITALVPDVIDYFRINENPANPNQYAVKEGWESYESVNEKIKIKGLAEPEELTVKLSRFGPVLNPEEGHDELYALSWTGMEAADVLGGVYDLNKANDLDSFMAAAGNFTLPHCNIAYADKEGNIAYYPTGYIPLRNGWDGTLPVNAAETEGWQGFLSEEEKPVLINPPNHYIHSANHQVADLKEAELLSADWIVPFRGIRIKEMLQNQRQIDMDYYRKMHTDTYSLEAEWVLYGIKKLNINLKDTRAGELLTFLMSWDYEFKNSARPGLFLAFKTALVDNIFRDEFKDIDEDLFLILAHRKAPLLRLLDSTPFNFKNIYPEIMNSNPWDDKNTEKVETAEEIIERSLLDAERFLTEHFGEDWQSLRWDDMHTLTFNHPLGSVWPLKLFFNRGPYGLDGGSNIIFAASHKYSRPYVCEFMPVMRVIYNLSDWDKSLIINSFGQSGNPFSGRYADTVEKFIEGEYNPMIFSPQALKENTESEFSIFPAEEK